MKERRTELGNKGAISPPKQSKIDLEIYSFLIVNIKVKKCKLYIKNIKNITNVIQIINYIAVQ